MQQSASAIIDRMRSLSSLIAACLLAANLGASEGAQAQSPAAEPDSGSVVCAPGVFFSEPDGCLPLGPSSYLTELANSGFTLPPSPLPASRPDRSLADIPIRYFHVISDEPVSVGSAPGDSGGQILYPGFVYIAYVDRVDTGQGIYYLTESGGWVPGKGERVGEVSLFQGLTFGFTPRTDFGWAFEDIPIKASPGFSAAGTGSGLRPFDVVQIYGTQQSEGADWYMIGPGQWVEARKVAGVFVNPQPPEGSNGAERWIDVDLAEQTLAVYEKGKLVFATMISSGTEGTWTRPGLHQIYRTVASETLRNNDPRDFYYLEEVPWTMYFDGPRALHGAYWRTRFGFPQSHGCVNLSVGDAQWLFNWAHEGDWVYVHDSTGRTPTDPASYGGGAY